MAYVYGHYRKDTGELFYIGKGIGKRAWSKESRNPHWFRVINKHGYDVRIIEDGLTEEQAYIREQELIAEVGLDNLTNMTEGGKGFTSIGSKQLLQRLVNDPNWKQRHAESRKKMLQNPKWWQTHKESRKRLREDSEFRKKIAERSQNPEWRKNVTEANRKLAQNSEWKQKIAARSQRPDYKEKLSVSLKKYWANKKRNTK